MAFQQRADATMADEGDRHVRIVARKNGLDVLESFGLQRGRVVRRRPNLMASVAVFKFQRS